MKEFNLGVLGIDPMQAILQIELVPPCPTTNKVICRGAIKSLCGNSGKMFSFTVDGSDAATLFGMAKQYTGSIGY